MSVKEHFSMKHKKKKKREGERVFVLCQSSLFSQQAGLVL